MSKKITIIALFLILIGSIWVRAYHYNEWLFFKWDQARDATLLAPAIKDGPQNLPLLGPRATKIDGDFLRLGPIYYYIQYATGVIFNSVEPQIFAYSDFLFTVLSILLFYFFLRIYFNRQISLLATALYAFSFLVIQYSRFSWNPNAVPFFTLATFYGLLKFADAKTFKNKLKWLAVWALSFAIASQYHFFAFFVLTGVSGLFFAYHFLISQLTSPEITTLRKEIFKKQFWQNLKKTVFSKQSFAYALITILIFGFLYTPVIISDIKTNGSNTKLFFKMFSASGREDKTLSQKIQRNFREQGDNYCLITTGFNHRAGMKADPITVGFGLFLVISALFLIKNELSFKKNDPSKRNFLILLLIWISVFFIITIPASYQLRPRYFVPVFTVPFIIIALWYSVLDKKLVGRYRILIVLLSLIIFGSNAYNTYQWFREQDRSQRENFKTYKTLILRHRDGVTLGQLKSVSRYLISLNNSSKKAIVYATPTEYYLPFSYLIDLENDSNKTKPRLAKTIIDLEDTDYIYVINNGRNESAGKKLRPYLEEVSHKQFGQLFVHKMKVVNKNKLTEALTELHLKQSLNNKDDKGNKKTSRLFWRDVLDK